MKRSGVGLADIADFDNLARAFHAAARGKRGRDDVESFRRNLERELASLHDDIVTGTIRIGDARRFRIRDPKPRVIHAPVFRERVLHHAIMAHVGPVLDRTLIFDSYACRTGKGTLAAVRRARDHATRHAWYTQIDISRYFAHIDHAILLTLLRRVLKNEALLTLLARIIAGHADGPGRGLPIGALTSQHFANFYLAGLDRLLLEDSRVRGVVRYMDDLIWWTDRRDDARGTLDDARAFLCDTRALAVKEAPCIGRSVNGIVFCGCRVAKGRLLLTRRGKRRYGVLRRGAEIACRGGLIDATALQTVYGTALAITAHKDAAAWRREELRRHPPDAVLNAL